MDINYKNANYLQLDLAENQFDLVIMIYTDFCVLHPEKRMQLLNNVRKWLKPGGIFIFDANSDKELEKKVIKKNWEVAEKGFWKDKPYLILSESYLYPKEKVILFQHIVSDVDDKTEVYRFYTHFFSGKDLIRELGKSGFSKVTVHNDVLPGEDMWNGEHIFFCIAVNSK